MVGKTKKLKNVMKSPVWDMAQIERSFKDRHLKLTRHRRSVLDFLMHTDRPIKVYDLIKSLKALKKSIKPASMYRVLNFLSDKGYIHKIEALDAYIIRSNPDRENDQFFMICTSCGWTREHYDSTVSTILSHHSKRLGFKLNTRTVEIFGLCNLCR